MAVFWSWVAGLITLAILSFVFKENPVYRLVEHLYVGASAGYSISVNFGYIRNLGFSKLGNGVYITIIPIALGLLLFTRYSKKLNYLSRWTTAFLVALGSGLALYGIAKSQLITQVSATFLPVVVMKDGSFNFLSSMNNWIMILGVLSVLIYFFFTTNIRNPVFSTASKFGRYLMMVSFGVAFGNSIMMNISLLLGTFDTVLKDMLHIF
ncbi:MAG: hypothetical protein LLG09_02930 [Negativicutes bacterium]|nr:hypothetical protein [Negativicutes bacterium]